MRSRIALVALGVVSLTSAACSGGGGKQPEKAASISPSSTAVSDGAVKADGPPAPLTGVPDSSRASAERPSIAVKVDITAEDGRLILNVEPKPETIRQLREEGEEVPEQPPIPIGLLPGEGDLHIVTDGPAKGMKGYFVRGKSGEIEGIHVGGRLATKTGAKK